MVEFRDDLIESADPPMMVVPTMSEVMKVRRHECRMRGHSWDPIRVSSEEDPFMIVCSNCGRKCRVVSMDQEKEEA